MFSGMITHAQGGGNDKLHERIAELERVLANKTQEVERLKAEIRYLDSLLRTR